MTVATVTELPVEEPLFDRRLTLVPAYMPQDETAGLDEYANAHFGSGAETWTSPGLRPEFGQWPRLVVSDSRNEVVVTIGDMTPDEAVTFADELARQAQQFAAAVRTEREAGR